MTRTHKSQVREILLQLIELQNRLFRNGEYITSGAIADTSPEQITELMVGHSANTGAQYHTRDCGETVLKAEGLILFLD